MGDDANDPGGLAGWRRYRAGVKPLRRPTAPKTAAVKQASQEKQLPEKKTWRRLALELPAKPTNTSRWQTTVPEAVQALAVDDPAWRRRLQAGAVRPEARLDLHHHGAAAAHQAVIAFIAQAQQRGQRILLIITGMGDVLQPSLPRWLQTPPLKASIRWVFPAAPIHGGQGAYYIVLRRQKSNDK